MGCLFGWDVCLMFFFHPAVVVLQESICVGSVSFSHRNFGPNEMTFDR